MNGLDEGQIMPQTFLYGCVLESGKDVVFNPEEDEFEHQLELRMACVDPSTKDEIHMVEVEGQDLEGQKVKAVLVSLKPSSLPSLCLGGFTVTPPAVFRLKAGSGPVHISGQHVVIMGGDQSFDEEDDEEEEEESLEASKKRPASTPIGKSQKKMKIDTEDKDEDDEDDEEDEEEDDDDEEEESEEEESPVKAKATPAKATPSKAPAQNGKGSKPSTPAPKQAKTPDTKVDETPKGQQTPKTPKGQQTPKTPKGPQTPKTPLTIPEIKAKMMESVKKGVTLPKLQPKFENYAKNCFRVTDPKVIAELWKFRQSVKEAK